MDLIFVRHGLPERDDGSSDPPLAARGKEQAERVADYLQGEQIDHVVASTMQRARQTAEPLADRLGLTIELRDELREVDDQRGSYVPKEQLDADAEIVRQIRDDPMSLFDAHGGWDSWRQRINAVVDDIVRHNRGRRVAVFSHGMVMATTFCETTGINDPFASLPDYTSLLRIKASSTGRRSLVSWNETAHLRGLL